MFAKGVTGIKNDKILKSNLLIQDQNPRDFDLVKPFEFSKRKTIEYDLFVDKVASFILKNECQIKDEILKKESFVFIAVVYELGSKTIHANAKLESNNDIYGDLYNDIIKKLEIKTKV